MSDKYLELANSTLGKAVFAAVGLPDPVPLQREDPNQPHELRGQVLLGASDGAIFAETIGSFITIAGAEVCRILASYYSMLPALPMPSKVISCIAFLISTSVPLRTLAE